MAARNGERAATGDDWVIRSIRHSRSAPAQANPGLTDVLGVALVIFGVAVHKPARA